MNQKREQNQRRKAVQSGVGLRGRVLLSGFAKVWPTWLGASAPAGTGGCSTRQERPDGGLKGVPFALKEREKSAARRLPSLLRDCHTPVGLLEKWGSFSCHYDWGEFWPSSREGRDIRPPATLNSLPHNAELACFECPEGH